MNDIASIGEGNTLGIRPFAEPSPSLREGQEVGPYSVIRLLGRGGMGEVYLARETPQSDMVALKIIRSEFAGVREFRQRFIQEAKLMARLHHPHIVPCLGSGVDDGIYWLAMKYIEGPRGEPMDLHELLSERREKGDLFKEDEAIAVGLEICDALAYAHNYRDDEVLAGILHRDLKPSNILVDAETRLLVADFGLARMLGKSFEQSMIAGSMAVTRTLGDAATGAQQTKGRSDQVGAPVYMSPEQVNGLPADARSDVYSIGAILYELFTGTKVAGMPRRPTEVRPELNPVWDTILWDRCLSADPDERYESAAELKRAIEDAERAPRKTSQKRKMAWIAGAAATVALMVGTWVILFPRTNPPLLARCAKESRVAAAALRGVPLRNLALNRPVRITTNGAEERHPGAGGRMGAITDGSLQYRNSSPAEMRLSDGDHAGCMGWVNDHANQELEVTVAIDLGQPCYISAIRYNMGDCQRGYAWGADTMATVFGVAECRKGGDFRGEWTEQTGAAQGSDVKVVLRKQRVSGVTDWLFVGEIEVMGIPVAEAGRGGHGVGISADAILSTSAPPAPVVAPRTAPVLSGTPWTNSLGMPMVAVPGTEVAFCVWETRNKDYRAFKPDHHSGAVEGQSLNGDDQPVVNVSWGDAKAFCEWLTATERQIGLISADQSYRLPFDWEWSVAVGLSERRGGTPADKDEKTPDVYPWGTQWPPPKGAGNYGASLAVDSFLATAPVGSFAPSAFGLFDMGGNVSEWCEDWYRLSQQYRVLRGGSWVNFDPTYLLSSYRRGVRPEIRLGNYGFRVVLSSSSP